MEIEEKLEIVKQISHEDKFRETVLMPLFDKMGLSPVHTHGSDERGKDIVCKEENSFSLAEWIAIVAKVGKITGSTTMPTGFQTVFNQVQEAFSFPYKDPRTKKEMPIAKVFVVTNDEITQAAQNRIVDKFGTAGAANANVHFIDVQKLVELIEEHWILFWEDITDVLTEEDWMTPDAGLVLYALALAWTLSQETGMKKKIESDMKIEKIQRQTGLSKVKVKAALNYLLRLKYVEKTKKDRFKLHSKETVGKLLMDSDQVRLLNAIKSISNTNRHFTRDMVSKEAKKDVLSFAPAFVKKALSDMIAGKYIKQNRSRGSGHYTLIPVTLRDERAYLANWLKYRGEIPISS